MTSAHVLMTFLLCMTYGRNLTYESSPGFGNLIQFGVSFEVSISTEVENVLFLLNSSDQAFVFIVYEPQTEYLIAPLAHRLSSSSKSLLLRQLNHSQELSHIHDLVSQNLLYEYKQHLVLLLQRQDLILELFWQVKEQALESPRLRWYVPMMSQETLEGLEALLREGSWVAGSVKHKDRFNIFSTRIDLNGSVKLVQLGFASLEAHTMSRQQDQSRKRYLRERIFPDLNDYYRDFQGRRVIAAALSNTPWYTIKTTTSENGSHVEFEGIDVNIARALSDHLNFTFQVVTSPDGKWGGPTPDGTITGMIGMVARHEVDFAIDAVWITLLVLTAIIGFLVFLVSLLANLAEGSSMSSLKVFINGPSQVPTSIQLLFRYSFNFFRCIVNQGNQLEPLQAAPRIVSIAWYFFCLNMYIVYSGILTSFLTLPSYEDPIDSLTDMYDATQERGYIMGLLPGSSQEHLFKFAENSIYADLWKTVTKVNYLPPVKPPMKPLDKALQKILAEPFTYIGDDVTLIMRSAKYGASNFYFAKETFYPQPFGIALCSGSPYRDIFNQVLLRLQESGLIIKWVNDVLEKAVNSPGTGTSTGASKDKLPILSLLHLQSAFILYGIGLIVAFLIFIGEIVVYTRNKKQPL
ncbi:glutamate receptor ionotropic, delta-2-like isoform X2 [Oratosquilla oratoria]|uniref:glutamate receptor ionotropic, delta-2-like isoform X2 n=1 Tax=Oratosquilla oratoria TaxID=337810 RepID=UPI003F763B66